MKMCRRFHVASSLMHRLLGLAALVGVMQHPIDASAQIHKCRHPDGRTSYSEQPCERSGGTAVGQIQAPARTAPQTAGSAASAARLAIPPEMEANCRKLQLEIDDRVLRVRQAQLDKTERMAEAARLQPPLSGQDRFILERHLDEKIGEHRIYLRGLVHSPALSECERGGIRFELEAANRLKSQPVR